MSDTSSVQEEKSAGKGERFFHVLREIYGKRLSSEREGNMFFKVKEINATFTKNQNMSRQQEQS